MNHSRLPLTIPTKKYQLSSGFPYHSTLFDLDISPDTWTLFSDDIVQATKLSVMQQSVAWTSGIGVGLVSVAALPPFGAAAGVFAGKAVYDKTILDNVRQGLDDGRLGKVLKRWNDDYWRERGVVAKLGVKRKKQTGSPDQDVQKAKEKRKERQREVGRFELVLDTAGATPYGGGSDEQTVFEVEDTHTNSVPVELASHVAGPSPFVHELPIPIPEIANEKAAVAHHTRFSWTSAHPTEPRPSPRFVLVTGDRPNHARETPVSAISQGPYAQRDRTSQDMEISPLSEVGGPTSFDLIQRSTEAMTPAPLFSR